MSGKKTKWLVLVVLLLVLTSSAWSQVTISAQMLNRELRVFFLSDFNFTGRGTASGEIFRLIITNGPTAAATFQLGVEITYNNSELLATGLTKQLTMDAGSVITITNQNLFTQAQKFSLQDYTIDDAGKRLRDRLLSTGKLPSGVYRFTFKLLVPGGGVIDDTYVEIDVSNPTTLDLIGPGAPADHTAPEMIFTTLPVFRWTSNITQFRLRLAEKLADVHDTASPAEIIQDRIRFERIFTTDASQAGEGKEYLPATVFQYPAAGVWPLQRGKIYFWQVTGLVPSSGAVMELPSEILAFQVSELDDRAVAMEGSLLLEKLRALLGERFDALFSSGGELAGFSPTGRNYLNGRWLTPDEVQALVNKLTSGEYILVEMRVE